MLSNKDFANILKSGGNDGNKDPSGKVRFDLKTISQWDKQNEQIRKKSKVNPNGNNAAGGTKLNLLNKYGAKDEAGKAANGTTSSQQQGNVYRDRALERRKELNNEDLKFEEIVSKLDAEQTRFLGGDVEHTHLVRGLDYALLEKIRKASSANNENDDEDRDQTEVIPSKQQYKNIDRNNNIIEEINTFTIVTTMGQNIKQLLLPSKPSLSSSSHTINNNKNNFSSATEKYKLFTSIGNASIHQQSHPSNTIQKAPIKSHAINKVVFEFSVDPNSENDVPLTVAKSSKDMKVRIFEDYSNHIIEADLLERIKSLFESGKMQSKNKKKRKPEVAVEIKPPPIPTIAPFVKPKDVVDSIYDDIIPVGKYIPTEQANNNPTHNSQVEINSNMTVDNNPYHDLDLPSSNNHIIKPNNNIDIYDEQMTTQPPNHNQLASSTKNYENPNESAKGLFKNILSSTFNNNNNNTNKATTHSTNTTSNNGNDNNNNKNGKDEIFKPVRDLMLAQAAKDRQQKVMGSRLNTNNNKVEIVVGKDEQGNDLIHRDVFASTASNVVKAATAVGKVGEVFGLHGSYSEFEKTNINLYDSDEDMGDDDNDVKSNKKTSSNLAMGDGISNDMEIDEGGGGTSLGGSRNANTSTYGNSSSALDGSIRKSVLKATTPWGNSGAGGGGATGPNRAARRKNNLALKQGNQNGDDDDGGNNPFIPTPVSRSANLKEFRFGK
eukprot:gene6316-8700_t